MLRTCVMLAFAAALAFSAFMFEATYKTQRARTLVSAAAAASDPAQRGALLAEAIGLLDQSWARPAQWHANAAETLSAAYASQALAHGGDRKLFVQSIAAARRAVALAPVQAETWARLAAFAQMDLPDVPCTVAVCLARSWRAAKMTDPETGCARLRIARAEGLLNDPNDARITWYVHSGATAAEIAQCLDFLPRDALFRRLLETR